MKELLILRHAKSSWKNPGLEDHERPLNKRGHRDAPRMGRWIRHMQRVPDRILSSTAVRAHQTARFVAEACERQGELQTFDDLYLASPADYLACLARCGEPAQRIMVVGHNPGLEELVLALSGVAETLPTAALALVSLPIDDWRELDKRPRGKLVSVWRPKELDPAFE